MVTIAVITISDRASSGEYPDRSGPAVVGILREKFPDSSIQNRIVPDEADEIQKAIREFQGFDLILTTGGSGLSPRDITPEITRSICDREIPGIGEWLRRESFRETPFAVYSRATAGSWGNTLIINLPGSEKGASFCTRLLLPLLEHGRDMVRGQGH